MTIQLVSAFVVSAAALYKVAALEVDRRLGYRRDRLERVHVAVDQLRAAALRVQPGQDHEAALKAAKRRLYDEVTVVDPLPRSTELTTSSQLDAKGRHKQSEAATVELNEARKALEPRPLIVSLRRRLRSSRFGSIERRIA